MGSTGLLEKGDLLSGNARTVFVAAKPAEFVPDIGPPDQPFLHGLRKITIPPAAGKGIAEEYCWSNRVRHYPFPPNIWR